jgi:hypothetical protein
MSKVLVIVGSGEFSLICDMCAIHTYLKDKRVSLSSFLTPALVPRQRIYHGTNEDNDLVYDPSKEAKFWKYASNTDLLGAATQELAYFSSIQATGSDRLIVIILGHGDEKGCIQIRSTLIAVGDFLRPLEDYPSSRIK